VETEIKETNDDERSHNAPSIHPPAVPPMSSVSFLWIWVCGVAATGSFLIAGAIRITSVLIRAKPVVEKKWTAEWKDISDRSHRWRHVRLLENNESVLGTWGMFRPVILIPAQANEWTDERIRLVLTHEFAHIKRFDWLLQIIAEIARCVYWFNPLFWIACRWLRRESEQACDSAVLNRGFAATDYAAHLLEIARTLKRSTPKWAPVLAMSQQRDLERRFITMFDSAKNHRALTRGVACTVATFGVFVTLPLAAMRATERSTEPRPTASTVMRVAASAAPTHTVKAVPARASKSTVIGSAMPSKSPEISQGTAQAPDTVDLTGVVSDASGAVIPGVLVTVTRVDGTVSQTTTRDAGNYEFKALPKGLYKLDAQLPGFANSARRLNLISNGPVRQNIMLSIGSVTEEVLVTAAGQARSVPPAGMPQRIRVGGNVLAATLISQVKPVYPQSLQNAGVQGRVQLQGVIATDGSLVGLRVVSRSNPDLAAAALDAVRQWRYTSAMLNGEPIEVLTDITLQFELQ
jgi:TonB family protein